MTVKRKRGLLALHRRALEIAVQRGYMYESWQPTQDVTPKRGRYVGKSAYNRARRAAPKPALCEICGQRPPDQTHHVIPQAQLRREGKMRDATAHVLQWVCIPCHEALHGHSVGRFTTNNA